MAQMTGRKNKKGRAIGGMVIGVRNGIEVIQDRKRGPWRE